MRLEAQQRFSLFSVAVDAPLGDRICGTLMLRERRKGIREGAKGGRAGEETPGIRICRLRISRFRTFKCSFCISVPVKSRLPTLLRKASGFRNSGASYGPSRADDCWRALRRSAMCIECFRSVYLYGLRADEKFDTSSMVQRRMELRDRMPSGHVGRPGYGRALYRMWRRARRTSITSLPNTGTIR